VQDKKFLRLVRSMLEAGYLEGWNYHRTWSGTPQGGVVSPLLANVFLHELDEFMQAQRSLFDRGRERRINPDYRRIQRQVQPLCARIDELKDDPDAVAHVTALKARLAAVRREQQQVPSRDPLDADYRRLRYVRYADDFLIGLIGSRQDAEQILSNVRDFLTTIGLTASSEKTKVTKATTGTRFLGHDVRSYDSQQIRRITRGGRHTTMRVGSGRMQLHVPTEKLRTFARQRGYGSLDTVRPCSRPMLLHHDDVEIVATFNAEMRGIAQFYALTYGAQSGQMHKLHHLWKGSLLMTLAHKHKRSVAKTKRRLRGSDGRLAVHYQDAKGRTRTLRVWELSDLTRTPRTYARVDTRSEPLHLLRSRASVIARWKAAVCEHCGASDRPVEVHHVRKVSDLQDTPLWRQTRSEQPRKTVILCVPCHQALHAGRLPDNRKS
jgi:RNA-directed DNA polymerase